MNSFFWETGGVIWSHPTTSVTEKYLPTFSLVIRQDVIPLSLSICETWVELNKQPQMSRYPGSFSDLVPLYFRSHTHLRKCLRVFLHCLLSFANILGCSRAGGNFLLKSSFWEMSLLGSQYKQNVCELTYQSLVLLQGNIFSVKTNNWENSLISSR